jgi:hypothetical protein
MDNAFLATVHMISPNIINKLIVIGRATQPFTESVNLIIDTLKKDDYINRLAPPEWHNIVKIFPINELIALVRGLTIVEREHRWTGGSVGAVIWTFRELEKRDQIIANEVADWVLANSNNPYLPYGSQNFSARSLLEYKAVKARHDEMIRTGLKEQTDSEANSAAERNIRKKQKERSSYDRTLSKRQELIEQLSALSLSERLEKIAFDINYTVNFFPTCWAEAANFQVLQSLSSTIRIALLRKLKGKQKGPWAKFKKRL